MFNRTTKAIVLSLLITVHVPAQAQPDIGLAFQCIQEMIHLNSRQIIAVATVVAASLGVRFRQQLRPLYDRLSQVDWHHALKNVRLEYDGHDEKNKVTVGGIIQLLSGKRFGGEVSHTSSEGGSTVSVTCQKGDHVGQKENPNEIIALVEEPVD